MFFLAVHWGIACSSPATRCMPRGWCCCISWWFTAGRHCLTWHTSFKLVSMHTHCTSWYFHTQQGQHYDMQWRCSIHRSCTTTPKTLDSVSFTWGDRTAELLLWPFDPLHPWLLHVDNLGSLLPQSLVVPLPPTHHLNFNDTLLTVFSKKRWYLTPRWLIL